MEVLTFINGATVSATDVRKSWSKIVQGVKSSHKPVFVCTNNTPEAVVISVEEFQNMQDIVEAFRREQLGQQMVSDLLEISELINQPVKTMVLNANGVFEEVDQPVKTMGLNASGVFERVNQAVEKKALKSKGVFVEAKGR